MQHLDCRRRPWNVQNVSSISQRPGLVWLVYGLGLVKFVLPFLLQHPVYEPHRDEFLYLAEGQHLSWGYFEAPPLLSLLSGFSDLLGGGFFWIKFWPALFGAMTYVLVGRMILLFGGGRPALLLGFLPFVFGIFLRVHFLLSPDFLGVYFETLMVYGLVRHIRTGKAGGLYLTGLGFGLGVLSQYTVLLFAAWLLIGLLLTPERKVLKSPHFYFAFLIGVLLLIPNLLWQVLHDWPALGPGAGVAMRIELVRDELLFNLPGFLIWTAGLYWVFGTGAGKEFRWVGWAVAGVLISVVFWGRRAEDAMGVYPVLFGFGALMFGKAIQWRVGLAAFVIVVGCVLDTVFLPMLPPKELVGYYSRVPLFRQLGFLRWPDQRDHGLPRNFADMLGWEEMAIKAARAYESLDSVDRVGALLNSGLSCGEAGALDYYGPKYSLPPVMGCRANYALWTPAAYYERDVYVVTTPDRGEMKKFASAVLVDSVTHPYSTEYGSYIMIVRGPGAAVRQEWKRSYQAVHRRQLAVR
jgi:hypothetical protein